MNRIVKLTPVRQTDHEDLTAIGLRHAADDPFRRTDSVIQQMHRVAGLIVCHAKAMQAGRKGTISSDSD